MPPVPIYDLSFMQKDPPDQMMWTKIKGVRVQVPRVHRQGGHAMRRDHAKITGIVQHQSDCFFQVTDLWRRRAARVHVAGRTGVDLEDTAHHLRALYSSAVPLWALSCGHVVQVMELDFYCNSANGFNATTISIENEGKFPGLIGKPLMTDLLLEAAEAAVKYAVTQGRKEGMPLRYIYAHRQSSAARRRDPGQEVWERVVLGYAVPALGLETRLGYKVGGGRPIPLAWDPAGVGKF